MPNNVLLAAGIRDLHLTLSDNGLQGHNLHLLSAASLLDGVEREADYLDMESHERRSREDEEVELSLDFHFDA